MVELIQELHLTSIFGSKYSIKVPKDDPLFSGPANSITLMFDGTGVVIDQEELKKFKDFVSDL